MPMPLTDLGFDDLLQKPQAPAMDYPPDDAFSEASLWLHSAGQLAQIAVFCGDEKFKLQALSELNRAVQALGFELIISRRLQRSKHNVDSHRTTDC
jgi:hypothetical protein